MNSTRLNAFWHSPLTSLNTVQRFASMAFNGIQRRKIHPSHYPAESSTFTVESAVYPLTTHARSILDSSLMNQETTNSATPVKRKHSGGGRAFHSRLEPFVDFIREQRQRRRTWREIAGALSEEKSCGITAQGIHQFYRRHLQRRFKGHWENTQENLESHNIQMNAVVRPQSRPAPLPPKVDFKRPDRSKLNNEEFT
jgi:hypothetical protein